MHTILIQLKQLTAIDCRRHDMQLVSGECPTDRALALASDLSATVLSNTCRTKTKHTLRINFLLIPVRLRIDP